MIVLKHKKTKKGTLKRNATSLVPAAGTAGTATDPAQQTEEFDVDSNRIVDRVALLTCALVDADLLDLWTDISAPIPVSERPAGCIQNRDEAPCSILISVVTFTFSFYAIMKCWTKGPFMRLPRSGHSLPKR